MPILELTSRERSDLRSAAHPLRPVVLIGDNGLTEAVLKEIDLALNSHGLIKVRAGGKEREDREAMLATVCEALACAPVHHLGKILILYRPLAGNVQSTGVSQDERQKRKASEPYTPKKLAAEGKNVSKTRNSRYEPQDEPAKPGSRFDREGLNKAGKPMRPTTKARRSSDDAHGIPRRSGSALSLRSGVRGRTATRKVTKR